MEIDRNRLGFQPFSGRVRREGAQPPNERGRLDLDPQILRSPIFCSTYVLFGAGPAGRPARFLQDPVMKEKSQMACKPGSVPAEAGDGHSSGTPVTGRLARPTRATARKPACLTEPGLPPLFGLAPGGVYPAAAVTGRAVRSYRTFSPLPGSRAGRYGLCGTFPGVAPAGHYPAPCFRGARTFLPRGQKRRGSGHPAIWHLSLIHI